VFCRPESRNSPSAASPAGGRRSYSGCNRPGRLRQERSGSPPLLAAGPCRIFDPSTLQLSQKSHNLGQAAGIGGISAQGHRPGGRGKRSHQIKGNKGEDGWPDQCAERQQIAPALGRPGAGSERQDTRSGSLSVLSDDDPGPGSRPGYNHLPQPAGRGPDPAGPGLAVEGRRALSKPIREASALHAGDCGSIPQGQDLLCRSGRSSPGRGRPSPSPGPDRQCIGPGRYDSRRGCPVRPHLPPESGQPDCTLPGFSI